MRLIFLIISYKKKGNNIKLETERGYIMARINIKL